MRPLVVGYSPVAGTIGESIGVAFVGSDSGRRLARYAGLPSDRHLLDHFDLVNLFRDPDAEWDRDQAERRASAIVRALVAERTNTVVLLSSPVSQAFGVDYHPLFQWVALSHGDWQFRAAACPHPSGLVRWWNDRSNVEQAGAFLRSLWEPQSAEQRSG